ncbi:MAG: NAD-dependent epimerase/dehydratase family protein [Candidatus Margulisiibacteriota bacterium]
MDFLKGKKILVTGARGMVGRNMVQKVAGVSGLEIFAADYSKDSDTGGGNIHFIDTDLTVAENCKAAVEGMDYVMMFAAKIDRRPKDLNYLLDNVKMDFGTLEAAYNAGVKKVLWLSSATGYPAMPRALKEDDMFLDDPMEGYFPLGWTNRYIETLCRMYATKMNRKMSVVILRPTAIYGAYGDFNFATSHVFSALIRKVAERQNPVEVWGKGKTKRDFIHVDDVVDACLLALEKTEGFDVFNVGLGHAYSVKELLEMIIEVDGFKDAVVKYDTTKPEKAPEISVDCAKIKEVIGFEPKTPIKDGIAKTIKWYKDTYFGPNKGGS